MNSATLQNNAPRTQERNLQDTGRSLVVWATCSIFLILLYALAFWREGLGRTLSIFSHGTLLAVAFGSIGSLVGFLFGIPRTLQSGSTASATGPQKATSGDQDSKSAGDYQQAVNTNLEQISDWLTKILVGVGLTQLQNIPQKLMGLAAYFQSGIGGNAPITLTIVLNSMVFGFFAGYLLTRLFLAGAFSGADRAATTALIVREQFAQGLTEAGAYTKAVTTLETTIAEVGPNTSKDVKRSIYEGLLYNNLYVDPPDGFQKAIEYGRTYIQEEPQTPSAKIWAYLAAAYGQQYKWEQEHGKRQAVLDSARQDALESVTNSLKLETKMKGLLRSLWDPNDPAKERSQEDDLEVFYADANFQKLLG
jgi:hypothetical protein